MEDGEVVDGAEHESPSQADGPDRQDPPRQRPRSASAGAASIGAETKVGVAQKRWERSRVSSGLAWDLEGKALDECLPVEKTTGRGR